MIIFINFLYFPVRQNRTVFCNSINKFLKKIKSFFSNYIYSLNLVETLALYTLCFIRSLKLKISNFKLILTILLEKKMDNMAIFISRKLFKKFFPKFQGHILLTFLKKIFDIIERNSSGSLLK